jgi:hypothetical protein
MLEDGLTIVCLCLSICHLCGQWQMSGNSCYKGDNSVCLPVNSCYKGDNSVCLSGNLYYKGDNYVCLSGNLCDKGDNSVFVRIPCVTPVISNGGLIIRVTRRITVCLSGDSCYKGDNSVFVGIPCVAPVISNGGLVIRVTTCGITLHIACIYVVWSW